MMILHHVGRWMALMSLLVFGISAAHAAAGRPLFRDSFGHTGDSMRQWSFQSASWKVADGRLSAKPAADGQELRAYAKGSDFGDGTISVDATLHAGASYGIFFHLSANAAQQRFNGYSFQYDPGYGAGAFLLRKWIHGVEIFQPLAISQPPAGFQWLGSQRRIEVTTKGSHIRVRVDDTLVISVSDDSYPHGGVGLRVGSRSSAQFHNISVTVATVP